MDNSYFDKPTSVLLAELRRREEDERYSVEELPSPSPEYLTKFGVYRDGSTRRTPRGPAKAYAAICSQEGVAQNIAELLNKQADTRRAAALL